MRARFAIPVVVAAVLFGAAACSEGDDSTVSAENVSDAAHNDADVTFAQGMIPHHQQAIEMAQMAADRAESAEVLDLAERIEAAQAPEIEELTAWLESWDEEVPAGGDHSGMDMDSGGGMMSTEDMDALEAASGAEFDQMFLEMMIEHHQGAIAMAEEEIAAGEYPDAIAMAEEIASSQQAEIDEMTALLAPAG
jgi:uncharacterized protein (DUF305 family)